MNIECGLVDTHVQCVIPAIILCVRCHGAQETKDALGPCEVKYGALSSICANKAGLIKTAKSTRVLAVKYNSKILTGYNFGGHVICMS